MIRYSVVAYVFGPPCSYN